jgi:hypothetical protein
VHLGGTDPLPGAHELVLQYDSIENQPRQREGEEFQEIKALQRKKGLASSIIFLGSVYS